MLKRFISTLAKAAQAFVSAGSNARQQYVLALAPVLAELHKTFGEDVKGLRAEWRKLTAQSYKAAGVRKGMARYGEMTSVCSMLLAISLERPSTFAALVGGKYENVRKLYDAIGNRKRGKGGKPVARRTVAVKLARFLSGLRPAQRAWVIRNVRAVARSLEK